MSTAAALSADELRDMLRKSRALADTRKLYFYKPYPKQRAFHAMGATKGERLLSAGNQQGKTYSGGAEAAFHATGEYPDWWEGQRFTERGTRGWVSGISNEQTRDNAQRMLYGPLEKPQTGLIPADRIVDVNWHKGVNDLIDTMLVLHRSGDLSYVSFKSYEQGRKKFQGDTLDWIWLDEEPPEDIYSECLARLIANAPNAFLFITFTPLLGQTEVVDHFFPEPDSEDRGIVRMEIEDAEHISVTEREKIIARFPAHEREARTRGLPIMGSGRVFPIQREFIEVEPYPIPEWWPRICGLDFGWDHPTAAVWMAWNRENDSVVLYDCYRLAEQTPSMHSVAIRNRGDWIPVAWPHDGYVHDKGTGIALALQYAELGCRMLGEHAKFADGSMGLEAGIMQMLDAMKTGRFKVFSTCREWWDEFQSYYRKDGQIVKRKDDTMSASRYAWMMRRFATTKMDRDDERVLVETQHDPLAVH